jgi:hypothetical protein
MGERRGENRVLMQKRQGKRSLRRLSIEGRLIVK